ncbi:hypothetical protein MATL_G00138270 [Megalops atlanticus]|uniref:Uncharacterized protein n=1 Tax=Megalops atlanticus TaxID=7932 RepID=A0A9D3PT58_MEGAT|nr:hypothetical protein MATL_G00138270 [Megalops atlanticus]
MCPGANPPQSETHPSVPFARRRFVPVLADGALAVPWERTRTERAQTLRFPRALIWFPPSGTGPTPGLRAALYKRRAESTLRTAAASHFAHRHSPGLISVNTSPVLQGDLLPHYN